MATERNQSRYLRRSLEGQPLQCSLADKPVTKRHPSNYSVSERCSGRALGWFEHRPGSPRSQVGPRSGHIHESNASISGAAEPCLSLSNFREFTNSLTQDSLSPASLALARILLNTYIDQHLLSGKKKQINKSQRPLLSTGGPRRRACRGGWTFPRPEPFGEGEGGLSKTSPRADGPRNHLPWSN